MHVILVNEPIGPAQLFDLVVEHEVTSVLDLRASGTAPQLLHGIYHRPTRVTRLQTLKRLVNGATDQTLLLLVERDGLEKVRAELRALCTDIQLEVLDETKLTTWVNPPLSITNWPGI
jgi:hypothetical protein